MNNPDAIRYEVSVKTQGWIPWDPTWNPVIIIPEFKMTPTSKSNNGYFFAEWILVINGQFM